MKPTINDNTRIGKKSASGLDQIIINYDTKYSAYTDDPGYSDHLAQILKINTLFKSHPTTIKLTRIFSEQNIQNFVNLLGNESWTHMYNNSNTNVKFNSFIALFRSHFNNCFPLKSLKNRCSNKKNSWITKGIKTSSKTKRHLYYLSKHFNMSPEFHLYFRKYKLILRKVVTEAKIMENSNYILKSKNRTKAMWEVVKRHTTSTNPCSENIALKNDNKLETDPTEVAKLFNKYFSEVGNEIYQNSPNVFQPVSLNISNSMVIDKITTQEVFKIINSFKNKYAAGIDEFPIFLIKRCASAILHPITDIINSSFANGVFPDALKVSKIKPLFKKGDKRSIENYRPIALLSPFSKILEKAFYGRLINFLTKYNILNPSQHGFRKSRSTETAIFSFLHQVATAVDRNENTVGLFLDLSKAFDTIKHNILLAKLPHYGIRGPALNWLTSFLCNRTQQVEITYKNSSSETRNLSKPLPVVNGVPQGSTLGPILFLLYINDLTYSISNGKLVLFADDTNLMSKYDTIQNDISSLSKWFETNKLIINIEKTVTMDFQNIKQKFTSPQLTINGNNIKTVTATKFLGIYIQNNLKWDEHLKNLNTKLSSSCYAFRILVNTVNEHVTRCVYFANVYSHLRYGIIFWGNSPRSIQTFRIQKRIIRIICKSPIRASCRPLFCKLQILTLPCIYIYETVLFVRQNLENNQNKFITNQEIHDYNTRCRNHIHQQKSSTTLFQNSTYNSGTKLYNLLPNYIKEVTSYNIFKTKLVQFLLDKRYYSVSEYLTDKKNSIVYNN